MDDDEYDPILKASYAKGDDQFKKWEKLATLGEALDPLLPACMAPYGSGGTE